MLPSLKYGSHVLAARILDLGTRASAQRDHDEQKTAHPASAHRLLRFLSGQFRFALLDLLFVVFIGEIVVADPGAAHFVDGPLTIRNQVIRIRVELVPRRVGICSRSSMSPLYAPPDR